jgi:hypothetical protein
MWRGGRDRCGNALRRTRLRRRLQLHHLYHRKRQHLADKNSVRILLND